MEKTEFREIPIDKIKNPTDHREPRGLDSLADSIEESGLLQPIGVRRKNGHYKLLWGFHRLKAHNRLNKKHIWARIYKNDSLHCELARVIENLTIAPLTQLERMECLEERQGIMEQIHPEKLKKGRPKKGEKISSFLKDAAARLNCSDRTVQLYRSIIKKIPKEIRKRLHDSPIADNMDEIRKFSTLGGDLQRRVLFQFKKGAKTVEQARSKAGEKIDSDSSPEKEKPIYDLCREAEKISDLLHRFFLNLKIADRGVYDSKGVNILLERCKDVLSWVENKNEN